MARSGFVDRQRDESDVQPPLADRLGLIQAAHVPHDDADLRVPPGERAQDVDEDLRVRRSGRADGQLADLALIHARRQVGRVRGLRQDDARLLDEHPAGFGELDVALGPVEQRDTELVFQLPDLLAERRLAEMQPLGGAAEVKRVGHGDDVPQVTKLHGGREPSTPATGSDHVSKVRRARPYQNVSERNIYFCRQCFCTPRNASFVMRAFHLGGGPCIGCSKSFLIVIGLVLFADRRVRASVDRGHGQGRVGRRVARRHGRSVESGADREDALGRDQRRSVNTRLKT